MVVYRIEYCHEYGRLDRHSSICDTCGVGTISSFWSKVELSRQQWFARTEPLRTDVVELSVFEYQRFRFPNNPTDHVERQHSVTNKLVFIYSYSCQHITNERRTIGYSFSSRNMSIVVCVVGCACVWIIFAVFLNCGRNLWRTRLLNLGCWTVGLS